MYPDTKTEYISLNLGVGPPAFVKAKPYSTRSLWRKWNQLSRFQRNILYFAVISIVIFIIYLLPGKTQIPVPIDEVDFDSAKAAQNSRHLNKGGDDILLDSVNQVEDDKEKEERESAHLAKENKLKVEQEEQNRKHPDALEEPEFQPEPNQVDNDQIGEPPPHKSDLTLKFNGPQNDRQKAVVKAFMHSWNGYKKFAWGHDTVKPISKGYSDWFGLGLTIVDSLDTLYMMGLKDEFQEARNWVINTLMFNQRRDVNLFEVTIRVLGGLLSAYHLSKDKAFLDKAIELGDRLLPAFNTLSGIPYADVNLGTRSAHPPKWSPDSSLAEIATLQLEFRDLSRSSNLPRFEEAVAKVSEHIHRLEKYDGLVPIFINANTGLFREYSVITLGARGDSYYEYLLKQWLQTGKKIDYLKNDYVQAMEGTEKHLVKKTAINKFLFIAELLGASRDLKPKMDHLTCYLSGTLALGVHNGLPKEHMDLATELLRTCYQTYIMHPTGLAPEITYFNIQKTGDENQKDMYVKTADAHNLLRPETIESLYYMWYFTGNKTYQDWGWRIFQAFENYTKCENGYTTIGNVKNAFNTRPRDNTESFWFGETLKYLYLLFDDTRQLINLDQWVFNSEAHPLPIYDS